MRVRGGNNERGRFAGAARSRADTIGEGAVDGNGVEGDPHQPRGAVLQHEGAHGQRVERSPARLEPERVAWPEQVREQPAARESTVSAERGAGRQSEGDGGRSGHQAVLARLRRRGGREGGEEDDQENDDGGATGAVRRCRAP